MNEVYDSPKLGQSVTSEEAGRVRQEQAMLEKLTHELSDRLVRLRDRLDPVLLSPPPTSDTAAQGPQRPPEPNRSSVAQQTHFIAGIVSDMCGNVDDLLRRLDV